MGYGITGVLFLVMQHESGGATQDGWFYTLTILYHRLMVEIHPWRATKSSHTQITYARPFAIRPGTTASQRSY
jgi:hypothetical protein